MNLVEKAGTIMVVAKQLSDVLEHAWREWDKPENTLRDDEHAKFNEMLRVLQPFAKQINNTLNLAKNKKIKK
jgi:hypothetical protein